MNEIEKLPLLKQEIEQFSQDVISKVESGDIDPLLVASRLKALELAIKNIRDAIKEKTVTEALKYGKSFEKHGFNIQVSEQGTRYDFTNCKDREWDILTTRIEALEKEREDREKFLKLIKNSLTIADEETGEIMTIHPPIKKSTTGLTLKLL